MRRWPAEWEPHEATWLAWPHNPATWPGRLEEVERVFGSMAAALSSSEEVRILAPDDRVEASARRRAEEAGADLARIRFVRVATNDAWIRDSGPIVVVDGEGGRRFVDFGFNSWGGKYPPWEDDDRIPRRLAEIFGQTIDDGGMILEGGSVDGNGDGAILTTVQCLLNPNRNPSLDRDGIERRLARLLGARQVIWLGDGIEGDDTDGHVDDVTRFVSRDTVVTAVELDPDDPNAGPLERNRQLLERTSLEDGTPLTVVPMPMPGRVENEEGRLPASYLNFYIANEVVLAPVFDRKGDDEACALLQNCFPDRRIVPVLSTALVAGFGACHCLTQQLPSEATSRIGGGESPERK